MDQDNRRIGQMIVGAGLIAVGVLLLVARLLHVDVWAAGWPFLFVLIGAAMFVGMFRSGRQAAGLAIPGALLVILGLLFFAQKVTGQWQSWAYAWTLIWPLGVGIGLLIQGLWGANPQQAEEGRRLIRLGAILFLAGLVFFELLLDIGGWGIARGRLARYVLPILLIAVGIAQLVRGTRPPRERREEQAGSAPEETHTNPSE